MPYTVAVSFDTYFEAINLPGDHREVANARRDQIIGILRDRLWDLKTHRLIGEPLTGHADRVTSVAFNPGGTTLASGSDDGSIRFWDGGGVVQTLHACELADRNLTAEEWTQFLPGRGYGCTCPGLPPGEGVKSEAVKVCPKKDSL